MTPQEQDLHELQMQIMYCEDVVDGAMSAHQERIFKGILTRLQSIRDGLAKGFKEGEDDAK